MDAARASLLLKELVIFKNLATDPLVAGLVNLLESESYEQKLAASSAVARALYPESTDATEAVFGRVCADDNFYVRCLAAGGEPDSAIRAQLIRELEALAAAAGCSVTGDDLPAWNAEKIDFVARFDARMARVATEGFGLFAAHRVFSVDAAGHLVPVRHPDPLRISDLFGYEEERGKVLRNTEALLEGLPAGNMLLYGDAGTGKSSTVKAVANELSERGLRLIQVEKQWLHTIPSLLDELADHPLKFILFIDDLSFSTGDGHFNALKSVLEGSVAARPDNVVVYATSNRRHLISETFSGRTGDDVHASDTQEEIAGLAARFGTIVTFGKPDRDQYIRLAMRLARKVGLDIEEEELVREAEAFAIRSGGRSPRTARQYVEGRIALKKSK